MVKDYIINKDNSLKEVVENKLLGQCIKDHVTDSKIQQLAARAAWIGNDETHYKRKWVTKDVNDLKKFIDLVTHWIEMEVLTDEMISDMPDGGPKI